MFERVLLYARGTVLLANVSVQSNLPHLPRSNAAMLSGVFHDELRRSRTAADCEQLLHSLKRVPLLCR